jgi:hypothetical protein
VGCDLIGYAARLGSSFRRRRIRKLNQLSVKRPPSLPNLPAQMPAKCVLPKMNRSFGFDRSGRRLRTKDRCGPGDSLRVHRLW